MRVTHVFITFPKLAVLRRKPAKMYAKGESCVSRYEQALENSPSIALNYNRKEREGVVMHKKLNLMGKKVSFLRISSLLLYFPPAFSLSILAG